MQVGLIPQSEGIPAENEPLADSSRESLRLEEPAVVGRGLRGLPACLCQDRALEAGAAPEPKSRRDPFVAAQAARGRAMTACIEAPRERRVGAWVISFGLLPCLGCFLAPLLARARGLVDSDCFVDKSAHAVIVHDSAVMRSTRVLFKTMIERPERPSYRVRSSERRKRQLVFMSIT